MIAIESEISDFELLTIRKLYDETCNLFGKDNIGKEWSIYLFFRLKFIKFFRLSQKTKRKNNNNNNIQKL